MFSTMKEIPESERLKTIAHLATGRYEETDTAIVGVNRGQFFVRLPKVISQRLGLEKGNKLKFTVWNENNEQHCKVDKVKDGTS